jgi:preprotein translocase subunit YajC
MSKKVWIPIAAILLVALAAGAWLYTDVAAQGRAPLARLRRMPGLLGQVTAVQANQFTLQTRAGQERTFRFDESTRFTNPGKQELSAADLQTGGWVRVVVARRLGQPRLARGVVILSPDFVPQAYADRRFLGRVTAVDAVSFTIQTRQGETLTIQVTAETVFRSRGGLIDSLDDLKAGMPVAVGADDLGDGQFQALRVLAAPGLTK